MAVPLGARSITVVDLRGNSGGRRAGVGVLEDPSGRRRAAMRRLGRAIALLFTAWLLVVTLGGLGLFPVAGLPFLGFLKPTDRPPPLPGRALAGGAKSSRRLPEASAAPRPRPARVGAPAGSVASAVPGAVGHRRRPPGSGRPKSAPTEHSRTGARTPSSSIAPVARAPGRSGGSGQGKSGQRAPRRGTSNAPGHSRTPPGRAPRSPATSPSAGSPGRTGTAPGAVHHPAGA